MAKRRVFRLAYPVGHVGEDGKATPIKVSEKGSLRDAEASLCVVSAYVEAGFRYVDTIMNVPPLPGEAPRHVDLSRFRPGDLIVVTTRLPLSDQELGDKRAIPRSDSNLEKLMFREVRKYFFSCGRSEIILQPDIAACSAEVRARRSVEPQQNGGAKYRRYSDPSDPNSAVDCKDLPARSAAYLLHLEQLWENGPGLVLAFGIGFGETLIWCRALSQRPEFRHLLDGTAFCMAEFAAAPRSMRIGSLEELDAWDITILGSISASTTPCPSGPAGSEDDADDDDGGGFHENHAPAI